MCVTFFAFQQECGIALLVAFNRDEVLSRPTLPTHVWEDGSGIVGGRDLVAGGTWLCVSPAGRVAFLTDYRERRDPAAIAAAATSGADAVKTMPSRGALPLSFVSSQQPPEAFLASLDSMAYPGFNLVVADLSSQQLAYLCNRRPGGGPQPEQLPPGLHGVANGYLQPPWPKVEEGCRQLQQLLDSGAFARPKGSRCSAGGSSSSAAEGDTSNSGRGSGSVLGNGSTHHGSAGGSAVDAGCAWRGGSDGDSIGDSCDCTACVPWEEVFRILSDDRVLEQQPPPSRQSGLGAAFDAAASSIFMQPAEAPFGLFGTRSQIVLAICEGGTAELRERYRAEDGSWQSTSHRFHVHIQTQTQPQQPPQETLEAAAAANNQTLGEHSQCLRHTPMAGPELKLGSILGATTTKALQPYAARLNLKFPVSTPVADRQTKIIAAAIAQQCLYETLCTAQWEASKQQDETEAGLQAARLGALESDVAAVRQQVGELVTVLKQQAETTATQQAKTRRQQELQAEEEKAAELGDQLILFPATSLEGQRDDPAALLAEGQRVAAQLGVAAASVTSAFLLKPKGDKPAPLVMRCSSVAAKRELLRARSRQQGSERVRLAPRLTPWQQQQKADSLQQFRDMRNRGEEVTFHCGWRLQRREDGQWVDVPVAAAA